MHTEDLQTLVSRELWHQLKHFDADPTKSGHHFHFVDIWPRDTVWSCELLLEVLKTIDRTMDRDDVVPVIVIQCPRLRTPPEPSQSLDEMVRMLMSPSDVDPPAVYLVPADRFRDQIVQQIDGICEMFSSQFIGWSIGVQPVPSSHPDFGNPPVVIYPSSVGCDN